MTKCASCGQKLEGATLTSYYHSMSNGEVPMHIIMSIMERNTGITQKTLRNKRRTFGLAQSRRVFVKLACEFSTSSYPMIGRFINRDHTTVMSTEKADLAGEYAIIYERVREKVKEWVTSSSSPLIS